MTTTEKGTAPEYWNYAEAESVITKPLVSIPMYSTRTQKRKQVLRDLAQIGGWFLMMATLGGVVWMILSALRTIYNGGGQP